MATRVVAIAGVGALGSHVGQFLRAVPNVSMRAIDFDRVETKNVLSQFHAAKMVGRNKAEAFKQTMDFLFRVKVEVRAVRITGDNVRHLLGDTDLVLDCLDNGESRKLIQDFIRRADIPCLHGALSAGGIYGVSTWDEQFDIDYGSAGVATCEGGEHLPFISEVAAAVARSAQLFLEKGEKTGYQIHPGGSFVT